MDPLSFIPVDVPSDFILHARSGAGGTSSHGDRPPIYKAIGISLAIASGLFIGTSFVLKKLGLLKSNVKYNEEAGEGYGYLKNAWWWSGMTLMIVGEVCNFVAYAFVDAILVTPLGALSVVVTTILSAIFLKERLSFVGKIGCFLCIIGSVVIVMNAPAQSGAATIQEMKKFMLAPGFLTYAGIIIVGCVAVAIWVAPRYGKKSMLVYLTICSLIGGLSVVSTQGLGAAIVTQAGGTPQFNQWFLYLLLVFVIVTLVTEIIYLNKALNLFNAALVTPTYYVYFTSSTIVTSAILFQGFKGSPTSIITVVMGFLVICSGVVLLQLSKSAKEVPDSAVFKGDLDQVRTVAEQEEPESEPKADAIRGTAAIIRRISNARQGKEAEEARRVHEDRLKDQMEPIAEDEQVQWDGLRRRKTTISSSGSGSVYRQRSIHPPLGMTHFPEPSDSDSDHEDRPRSTDVHGSSNLFHGNFFNSFRRNRQPRGDSLPSHTRTVHSTQPSAQTRAHLRQRPVTEFAPATSTKDPADVTTVSADTLELTTRSPTANDRPHRPIQWDKNLHSPPGSGHSSSTLAPPPTPPAHGSGGRSGNKRQFSFQNVFPWHRSGSRDGGGGSGGVDTSSDVTAPGSRDQDVLPRSRLLTSRGSEYGGVKVVGGTEEERLGLVKGDTRVDEEEEGAGRSSDESERERAKKGRGVRAVVDEKDEEEEEWMQGDEKGGLSGRQGRFRDHDDDDDGGRAAKGKKGPTRPFL